MLSRRSAVASKLKELIIISKSTWVCTKGIAIFITDRQDKLDTMEIKKIKKTPYNLTGTKQEIAEKVKLIHYNKWLRLHRREVDVEVNAHLLAMGKAAFDI
jgi:hypothetical protein